MILSVLPVNYSGFFHQGHTDLLSEPPCLPSKFPARVDCPRDVSLRQTRFYRMKINGDYANHICTKFVMSATRNDLHLNFDDDLPPEPFPLTFIKEALWGLKSLFVFLVEQPSQLKYIEWPSFSSTLRTATLTLVLVALLIVALSSVDSALCYLLALVLRKSP